MRKTALFLIMFLFPGSFLYALKDCSDLEFEYEALKEQVVNDMDTWRDMSPSDPQKALFGKALTDLLNKGVTLENNYNDCLQSIQKVNELIETYFDLGDDYFHRKQWDKALEQYKKILDLDPGSYKAHYNIGSAYVNKNNLDDALEFYGKAHSLAEGKVQMKESKIALEKVEQILQKQEQDESAPSDDTFSHLQYYLRVLGIPEAWKQVEKPKEVVVAVIDDGVNINHPDLTNHIWIETGSAYGSSKIKDFVGDNLPDNLPTGEHGTMIAGIIGAETDNKKGIAGIAKNVKIMPLRVFDFKGNAHEEDIINAIYYAINHKAHIINLSLGQSQFAYSTKYDAVMKKAYESGVIVVIASGNGDVLAFNSSGVNTTVNPLSPVCNNMGTKKYSLGVESLDQEGVRARWSNYGACVSFAVPGENIFSTSVSVFNKESGVDYDTASGTSFSAPMIAGIIALGYNKYGYISPDTVYMSLNESMEINKAGNYVVNAKKYLDILEKKKAQIQKEQQEFEKNGKVTPSENKKGETILSDTEFLQNKGVIDNKKYILSELVGRFEVVSIAMKILNIYLPPSYTCRGMYMDISGSKNTLMCQIVEMATEKGLVTVKGNYFRPEEHLSLIETLGILMRAGNVPIDEYSGGEFEPWEANVVGTAYRTGIMSDAHSVDSHKKTLRSELFSIARRILLFDK